MEATLTDVKDQLQAANEAQEDQSKKQEKTNSLLSEIGENFQTFFKAEKNKRLDELERQREAKRTPRDARGRFIAQREDRDRIDLTEALSKLGFVTTTIAVALGTITGSIAGVVQAYVNFFRFVGVDVDKRLINARGVVTKSFDFIRTLPGSIATAIRQTVFRALGLGVDGRILTQFNTQTRRFERVNSIGARLKDAISSLSATLSKFTTPIMNWFGSIRNAITTIKFPDIQKLSKTIARTIKNMGFFGTILRGVFFTVSKLVGAILFPILAIYGFLRDFFRTEGGFLEKFSAGIIGAVQLLFNFIVSDIVGYVLKAVGGILEFLGVEGASKFFTKVADTFRAGFNKIFDSLKISFIDPESEEGFFRILGAGISRIFGAIGNWWDGIVQYFVDTFNELKSNPLKFFFPRSDGDTADEVRAEREFNKLDEGQQNLVRQQNERLVKFEVAREQGRISENELKELRQGIEELVEAKGVSMNTVVNAPQTSNVSSNTTMIDTPSPATDSLDRTR